MDIWNRLVKVFRHFFSFIVFFQIWRETQRLWLYLEPIFASGEISKQLPGEAERFVIADRLGDCALLLLLLLIVFFLLLLLVVPLHS